MGDSIIFIIKPRIAFMLLTLLLSGCFMFASSRAQTDDVTQINDVSFSIFQITDTQYVSWNNTYLFYDLTNWIVDNSQNYNVKMVIHTGDLVDTPTHTSEWEVANSAMMTLFNNGIPYCWTLGNHDQLPPNETANLWLGDSNTDWLGSQYPAFNQTIMQEKPYWVSDIFNGKNTAVAFDYSDYQFLIINVEFLANSSTLNWMRTLIESNPQANIIVTTHDYLNRTGGYGTRSISNSGVLDYVWGSEFKGILDQYPNVFLTLSGHIQARTIGGYHQQVGNRQEVFFNRQEINNRLGASSVRIYNFSLSDKQVHVSTFALDTQTWLSDDQNRFSFSIDLKPSTVVETPDNTVPKPTVKVTQTPQQTDYNPDIPEMTIIPILGLIMLAATALAAFLKKHFMSRNPQDSS